MQTQITKSLALGIPGEFANTNPRRVDSYLVTASVTMGAIAAVSGGNAAPVGTANYTTVKGVFVSPHQHVNYGVSGNALAPTLAVAAGDTVGVVTMGDVFVKVAPTITVSDQTSSTSEADAKSKAIAAAKTAFKAFSIARNASIYYTSAGAITDSSTSNTLLGIVVIGNDFSEADDAFIENAITVTVTESAGTYTATTALKTGFGIVVAVRIG